MKYYSRIGRVYKDEDCKTDAFKQSEYDLLSEHTDEILHHGEEYIVFYTIQIPQIMQYMFNVYILSDYLVS